MSKIENMKLIFISGPSGSGKTTLSNQILSEIENGYVLSTDNYYKTGLISRILSKFVKGYFDRRISFNYKLFKKDFKFIMINGISLKERQYNFQLKAIETILNEVNNIKYLIIEGIFAKDFLNTIHNQKIILIELNTNKNECMKRVLKRDRKERGKEKKKAKKDFLESWDIYNKKFDNKSIKSKTNEIIILKNSNIDEMLKDILINFTKFIRQH